MSDALYAGLPAPGKLPLGKYRVERVLGEGGMGIVLAATHLQLNEQVAIKLLHPKFGMTGARYARFIREARAASSIRSEHVVRVFDLGALEDGSPYIAMELLRGTDLASVVASRGPLPLADAVDYVLQACEGIAEAHTRQIVHRDLKPANLFLTRRSDGSACVKVLDFGISKVSELAGSPAEGDTESQPPSQAPTRDDVAGSEGGSAAAAITPREEKESSGPATTDDALPGAPPVWNAVNLTRTRGRLGSPKYMSPEQTRSAKHVDARADIWALGTILYELLTATSPFDADSADELSARIASAEPASVRQHRPDIPDALEAAIRRCLAKKADDRFADVGELATALAPFATAEGASSANRAARILRHADGGSSIIPPPIDALAPTVDASTGATKPPTTSRWRRRIAIGASVVGALFLLDLGLNVAVPAWLERRANRSAAEAGGSRMSTNPDAVAAYETGMRAVRDGSLSTATASLDRATELDGAFAAAHLGRALVEVVTWDSRENALLIQEHLRAARASRESLGERDRVLFDALEPAATVPPNQAEVIARLQKATSDHPFDALLRFALGVVLDAADRPEASDAIDKTLRLDGSFALAWDVVAHLNEARNVSRAIEAENRCLAISPGADTCLWRLAIFQSALGKCEEEEATLRRILALTPRSASAYRYLAGALAARRAPLEAVQFALEKRWELLSSSEEAAAARAEDEASLAVLTGDLPRADAAYRALETLRAEAPIEAEHFRGTYGRMLVEREMGDDESAVAAAKSYLARRPAWSAGMRIPKTISIYAQERLAGALTEREFDDLRDRWVIEDAERRRTSGVIPAIDFAWTLGYAQTIRTPDDARAALATRDNRDAGAPFFEIASWEPDYDEWNGKAYLLAGRLEEATELLGRASRSCNALAPRQGLFILHATAELGQALEAKGDAAGACAAYSRFLSFWPRAKSAAPVTTEVESRASALHCGPG